MALTRPKYSQIYDTDWKQSVELATTLDVGNLVLANVQPNSIDGINVQTNYRILVKDQNSGAQNGIYFVRNAGTGSDGWWTRSLDAAQNSFVTSGLSVSVVSGSVNGGKEFKLTTPDPITLGVTGLTFINPFASAGAGGANAQVQFNDLSTLGGSAGLTFNKFSNALTVSGNIVSTSGYFLGNGALLTGIISGGGGGGTNYSNVNVQSYTETMGFQNYSNVNVAAYTQTQSYTNYSNVNVAAYTQTQNYTSYSNVNVATYLPTYSGNIANIRLGVAGVLTFADGTTQTTAGGGSYSNVQVATYLPTYSGTVGASLINSTGNILSTGLSVFGNTRIGSLAVPGALHTIIGNVDVSGAGTEYFNIGGNILAVQASFGSINLTGFINTTGNISSGGNIRDSKGDVRASPINSQPGSYTAVAADAGKTIVESLLGSTITFNASVFAAGDMVSVINTSAGNITLVQGTSVTLRLAGTATTGNRTVATNGLATLICSVGGATPTFYCSGAGLT